ncbi:MAG: PTS fructose transporter subunit IIA [Phycisphaerae bacterium]|nr:PTS fructose transporter subunit IIA [Phycisphaerae bacterium]
MKLMDIVQHAAIVPALTSSNRDGVIGELVDALVRAGATDASTRDALMARLLEREAKHSTGFGHGVAVPHVKHDSVTRVAAAVGLHPRGVDFSSLDKQPVYTTFLLLSPASKPEDHLQAMEVIFKCLQKETFRRYLRQATTTEEVVTILEQVDDQHLAG